MHSESVRSLLAASMLCVLAVQGFPLPGVALAQGIQLRPEGSVAAGFGFSVALTDRHLIVGAPGDDERGLNAGAIYLFDREDDDWRPVDKLTLPAGMSSHELGRSLAASGATLLVGEPRYPLPVALAGRAHVFSSGGGGLYRHTAVLQPPELPIAANFGADLAIDDDIALIGSLGADGFAEHTGAVYVYVRSRQGWQVAGKIAAPDGVYRDAFGESVSLHGELAVIGAPRQAAAGAAYVYRRADEGGTDWILVSKLAAADGAAGDRFGEHVALHGNRVIVGAPGAKDTPGIPGAAATGAAYLFDVVEGEPERWAQTARLCPAGESGDEFGAAVALKGDMAAVGAPGSDAMGLDTGVLHLYAIHADRSPPTSVARLAVPSSESGAAFARSLQLSDDTLLVGVPGSGGNVGVAVVYDVPSDLRGDHLTFELLLGRQPGLGGHAINAIVQDAQGYLVMGTIYGGLKVFDGSSLVSYRHDALDPSSLSNDVVLSLLRDRSGRIWVGTEDGVNRFELDTGRFVRYPLRQPAGVSMEPVVALYVDRAGVVWAGTHGRLYRYVEQADLFEEFNAFTGPPERLDETYVSGIQQDSWGNLWVLAKNLWENRASLYRIDVADRRVERFPLAEEWGQVGPFLIDSRNEFWLKAPLPAVFPPGADGVVRPARRPDPDTHWAIYEDREGAVWLGTNAGFYRHDPRTRSTRLHRIVLGASTSALWERTLSFFQTYDGMLLMGTAAGVYRRVDPDATARAVSPPLVLQQVEVAGRDGSRIVRRLERESIELSHRDYGLTFVFAALDLVNAARVRYRYQLEPFDRDWVDGGTERRARYTNVPPGDYVFRVETVPPDGGPPPGSLSFAVSIAPPYWRTWWFRGLVALALVGVVAGAYGYRIARHRELETLRMRIASDLHDDLSTNLSGIALMSERVSRGGELGRRELTYLTRISATSRTMLEDLRDLVWMIDPGHDRVEDLVAKMSSVAETLLQGGYVFSADELASVRNISMEQRREILRIYKELLHNVLRHARADRVSIEVRERGGGLLLRIEDDGIGFDPEMATQGHGLKGLRARADRLGGTLQIDSRPGDGTRATFVLDLD